MKRVLVDVIGPAGSLVEVSNDEAHHLTRVRRTSSGALVEVLDGKGGLASGKLVIEAQGRVGVQILEKLETNRESPLNLQLALAIPGNLGTFEQMLPGLVQLGVQKIYLVPTEFSGRIRKPLAKFQRRLHAISLQALKQCGRTVLAEIEFPSTWTSLLTILEKQNDLNLVFHPGGSEGDADPQGLKSLGLMVGPEGGFSQGEIAQAIEAGVKPRALGPRILKMETAAIGVCFWAQSQYGDYSL